MSQEQFLTQLFPEYMSKKAMEILSGSNPSVAALCTKGAETEIDFGGGSCCCFSSSSSCGDRGKTKLIPSLKT